MSWSPNYAARAAAPTFDVQPPAGLRALAGLLPIIAPLAVIAIVALAHVAGLNWLMGELVWWLGA